MALGARALGLDALPELGAGPSISCCRVLNCSIFIRAASRGDTAGTRFIRASRRRWTWS